MKKSVLYLLFATMALVPHLTNAQNLKNSGKSTAEIVPQGWAAMHAIGDLNNDGVNDMAIIATPNHKEKMRTREDGYVYNFNQPQLAIYWGVKGGGYKLYKNYDKVIPAREDEFISIDPSLEITKNGTLKIGLEYFASAGSWTQPTIIHVFRYQNGDFFLIGKDVTELERNSGKTVVTSDNYLTGKRIVTTSDSKSKTQAKRSDLSKSALKPLGFKLDD